MSIDIGGQVIAIVARTVMSGEPPQPLYVRDVTFQMVGTPMANPPTFTLAVTDATKWDEIKVGQTYTVSISGGSIP